MFVLTLTACTGEADEPTTHQRAAASAIHRHSGAGFLYLRYFVIDDEHDPSSRLGSASASPVADLAHQQEDAYSEYPEKRQHEWGD